MQSPLEAIHEYYKVFSTLDVNAIVSFYCEPTMSISPQGVLSSASHAALTDALAPLVHSLRAKSYGRSEFVDPNATMLGQTDALVRGVAVRYTTAGHELERVPLSYVMHLRYAAKIAFCESPQN